MAESPWYESDPFWERAGRVLFSEADSEEATRERSGVTNALGLHPGQTVLDVFCGPGRFAVPLAHLGYHVTGVDRTLQYLKDAFAAFHDPVVPHQAESRSDGSLRLFWLEFAAEGSENAEKRARELVSLENEPIQAVSPGGGRLATPADGALWLGLSSGYAGPEADLRVLRWIRRQLSPQASLLIEASTVEDLRDTPFISKEWFYEIDDNSQETTAVWLLEHRLSADNWFEGRWRRFCLGTVEEASFRYRVYSRVEWSEMLHEADFSNVAFANELGAFVSQEDHFDPPERARSWIRATRHD